MLSLQPIRSPFVPPPSSSTKYISAVVGVFGSVVVSSTGGCGDSSMGCSVSGPLEQAVNKNALISNDANTFMVDELKIRIIEIN